MWSGDEAPSSQGDGKMLFGQSLAQRISLVRRALGLTQEQFGSALGISGSQIGKIEAGTTQPTLTTLVALRLRYRISVDVILDGALPPSPFVYPVFGESPGRSWTSRTPVLAGIQAWECLISGDDSHEFPHIHGGIEILEVLDGDVILDWGPATTLRLNPESPTVMVPPDFRHALNLQEGTHSARVRFTFDRESRLDHVPDNSQEHQAHLDELIRRKAASGGRPVRKKWAPRESRAADPPTSGD